MVSFGKCVPSNSAPKKNPRHFMPYPVNHYATPECPLPPNLQSATKEILSSPPQIHPFLTFKIRANHKIRTISRDIKFKHLLLNVALRKRIPNLES
ncbi:[F-actin]-monooxygenase MICAL3 [Dirofilaria immitis]